MIKKGDLKSYKDLLDPKWKGKIVLYNPWRPSAAAGWATFMISDAFGRVGGEQFLRDFAATEPLLTSDVRQQIEWVAKGKYPIGVGVQHASLSEFKSKGAPVTINRFIEGGNINPGSACVELSPWAPHPNAAAIYINWLLTKEGQAAYARGTGSPPARNDVPLEGLGVDPSKIAGPNDKAFITKEAFYKLQGTAMKLAREIWKVK